MCMREFRAILQPIPQHAIHTDMRKPRQRQARDTVVPLCQAGAQQDDGRRLGVEGVVDDCSDAGVGEVAGHSEIGDQEQAGEGIP